MFFFYKNEITVRKVLQFTLYKVVYQKDAKIRSNYLDVIRFECVSGL